MSLRVHVLEVFEEFEGNFMDRLTPLVDSEVSLSAGPEIEAPRHVRMLVSGVPGREHIEACTELSTLIIPWSGLPRRTRELMLHYPHIAVYNLHYNAAAVAEQALALMFAAAKRLIHYDRKLRGGDWRPRYAAAEAMLLDGKSVLVLGYGAIGRRIGSTCRALGARVYAIRSRPQPDPDGQTEIRGPEALHDLLPRASVLFITTPWTPRTNGLIGAAELALLPTGAVVVNVARGGVVEEHALYRALVERRIAAGLDVWYRYPETDAHRAATVPAHFPFGALDNVVLTPHVAGHAVGLDLLLARDLAHTLNCAARGENLPHRVDVERGY